MSPDQWKPDITPKSLYNPLKTDFTFNYRGEDNTPHEYTVPSMEIITYPTFLADHAIKHLIDEVINDRGLGFVTPEQRSEIQKEIEVQVG